MPILNFASGFILFGLIMFITIIVALPPKKKYSERRKHISEAYQSIYKREILLLENICYDESIDLATTHELKHIFTYQELQGSGLEFGERNLYPSRNICLLDSPTNKFIIDQVNQKIDYAVLKTEKYPNKLMSLSIEIKPIRRQK